MKTDLRSTPPNTRMPCILIVDDEAPMRHFLRLSLEALDFVVVEAATADEALTKVHEGAPDLLLLDLGLPDLDGRQVIGDVRRASDMPIIVLSGRTEDSEKIAALEQGADDYVTKPFVMHDLVERIEASLRQRDVLRGAIERDTVDTGGLSIGIRRDEVTRDRLKVDLSSDEYALLRLLALHGGRVLTSGHIQRALWNNEGGASHTEDLRRSINSLRRKLETEPAFPSYIVTEPSVGYRLEMLPVAKG